MIQILAVLAVLLLGAGIAVSVVWFVGTRKPPGPPSPLRLWMRKFWAGTGRTVRERQTHRALLITAVIAGALTWVLTGWPVGGLIVLIAIPGVPWLFTASSA